MPGGARPRPPARRMSNQADPRKGRSWDRTSRRSRSRAGRRGQGQDRDQGGIEGAEAERLGERRDPGEARRDAGEAVSGREDDRDAAASTTTQPNSDSMSSIARMAARTLLARAPCAVICDPQSSRAPASPVTLPSRGSEALESKGNGRPWSACSTSRSLMWGVIHARLRSALGSLGASENSHEWNDHDRHTRRVLRTNGSPGSEAEESPCRLAIRRGHGRAASRKLESDRGNRRRRVQLHDVLRPVHCRPSIFSNSH